MKVTKEKLPKSLLALDIELDREQVEKGLDRAVRRLSQNYNIPGFRKGKAPRFIVENYFGRAAILEEASDDLINKAFKQALEQEQIRPVGRPHLEGVSFDAEPYHFRVTVPVAPTVTLPDYRQIRAPYTEPELTDEMVAQALDERRERHVVLREPEESRPAHHGDQLILKLESFVDGEPLEERNEDQEIPETTIILEPNRLVDGLYDGLLGITADEEREITVQMPDDYANERVRGKQVTFKAKLLRLQERLLPEWDELPVLEEVEGTLDDLREKTREDLLKGLVENAQQETVNAYIEQLVAQTEYDIPDALIEQEADDMLHRQAQQFERYGITLEQMLQFRGKTHDEAVEELKPEAEERLKRTLALGELVRTEQLETPEDEINVEIERIVATFEEEQREQTRMLLSGQLRSTVAGSLLDKKLRDYLFALATGVVPTEANIVPSDIHAGAYDADGETSQSATIAQIEEGE